jgi:hypothetical protein
MVGKCQARIRLAGRAERRRRSLARLPNCVLVESSMLFNHLPGLEACRGTNTDQVCFTVGFLNVLLDFIKQNGGY